MELCDHTENLNIKYTALNFKMLFTALFKILTICISIQKRKLINERLDTISSISFIKRMPQQNVRFFILMKNKKLLNWKIRELLAFLSKFVMD
ncbi:hypothetical protein T08_1551 [Trichinella sp. T8]|nr:hypothetical protein T08_1551 [Trichinella sp. T8]